MKINTISVIVMLLASAMLVPVGLSYEQSSNVTASIPSHKTGTNQTVTMKDTHSSSMGMNQTTQSTNATVLQTNDAQAAQQVSAFIHKAAADFKQQGDVTRKVMLDCRNRLQTAASGDISSIKNDCSIQLNAIKAKYQEERIHYHDLVKQYRQSVMVFLNDARGLSVSKTTIDSAIAQLSMMMHATIPSGTMGHAATINNTHCVNPPGGPAIC